MVIFRNIPVFLINSKKLKKCFQFLLFSCIAQKKNVPSEELTHPFPVGPVLFYLRYSFLWVIEPSA